MPLNDITDVFVGASVVGGDIVIDSGSLISCESPSEDNPSEIIFGMLENINKAINDNNPTYLSSIATSAVVDGSTYRRTYVISVDLAFNDSEIIELLDVKAEPTTTTTTTTAP
jgi:hypothetical protein